VRFRQIVQRSLHDAIFNLTSGSGGKPKSRSLARTTLVELRNPASNTLESELFFSSLGRHVRPQPRDKVVEAELICFIAGRDEDMGLLGIGGETRAVNAEERARCGEGRAFVAVDECLVLREALL
jgi:hypothetical protein